MHKRNCLEIVLDCQSGVVRETLKTVPIKNMRLAEEGESTRITVEADTPSSLMKTMYLLANYTNFIFKTVNELDQLETE